MMGDDRREGIDGPAIMELVDRFYGRVRRDPRLGPIFARAIPLDAWPNHLDTMVRFWSSVMLGSGTYKGTPLAAHQKLLPALTADLFARWLDLFGETADEVFVPTIARALRVKAGRIAESLTLGLYFRPADLAARSRPTAPPPD